MPHLPEEAGAVTADKRGDVRAVPGHGGTPASARRRGSLPPVSRHAFALALGERDREGADVPGEGVEFGTVNADGLELELLGLGQGLRAAEDASGSDEEASPWETP